LRRTAAYTRCLRCAGAPRRPTSGSGLSLSIPSWHAVLYDPGEFDTDKFQSSGVDIGLRRDLSGSALPMVPQIRFTRGPYFGASWFTHSLRPARLLAPLCTDLPVPRAVGVFYFQAPDGSAPPPAAGYDYSIDWTPMLAGLSPAGMAASLAAPDPTRATRCGPTVPIGRS